MLPPRDTVAGVISKDALARLNALLPWKSKTFLDAEHRVLGSEPAMRYSLHDDRVVELDRRIKLVGRSVVEVGCFEGGLTAALCSYGANVIAVEPRIESLAAAMVRCGVYGFRPWWLLADIESEAFEWPAAEIYFHCGVLYHLANPVVNLKYTGAHAKAAILLDTHYTEHPTEVLDGFRVEPRGEQVDQVKDGLRPRSHWMELKGIVEILDRRFARVEVVSQRVERNGPRVTIIATGRK